MRCLSCGRQLTALEVDTFGAECAACVAAEEERVRAAAEEDGCDVADLQQLGRRCAAARSVH